MEILQAAVAYLDDAAATRERLAYEKAHVLRMWPNERTAWTQDGRTYMLPRWEALGPRLSATGAYVDRAPPPAGAYYATPEELGTSESIVAIYFMALHIGNVSRFRAILMERNIRYWETAINTRIYLHQRVAAIRRRHALAAFARQAERVA